MTSKLALVRGAALGVLAVATAAGVAEAKPVRHHHVRRHTTTVTRTETTETVQAAPMAPPPPSGPTTAELQAQVDYLTAQVESLTETVIEQGRGNGETRLAIAQIPADIAKTTDKLTLPNGRPTFTSADGRFSAALNGVLQFDAGLYFQDVSPSIPTSVIGGSARDLNSGTNARRARIGFGGKVFGDFDYNFLYDFGGSGNEDAGRIHELWFQYSGWKPWHLRVGYFEALAGMDANTSTNQLLMLERSSPADVARGVAAGDFRAGLAFFGNGEFAQEIAPGVKTRWLAGVAYTGNTVGNVNSAGGFATVPNDEQSGVVVRGAVDFHSGADWNLHLGANYQYVFHLNDIGGVALPPGPGGVIASGRYTINLQDRPELRLDPTRLVSTGGINASHVTVWGLEGGAQWHNLYAQAEYFDYKVDANNALQTATVTPYSPEFSGWYVQGSWILTGEYRSYNAGNGAFGAPTPRHPFDLSKGQYGAFELGLRYSDLDLNDNTGAAGTAAVSGVNFRGGEQKIVSASLNWYLNPVVKFLLQVQNVKIDRLNGSGATAAAFPQAGQEFQTLAIRSQLAF